MSDPLCCTGAYLLILLRVSLTWGNFSLNESFMSFFRSDGLTYSITVVWMETEGGEETENDSSHPQHLQHGMDPMTKNPVLLASY